MLGSAVLEVTLGLAFFFAAFSFGCTAAVELLESIRPQRGKQLAIFLERMLGAELVARLFEHGCIRSLSKAGRQPSYIPARCFAAAVLDLLGIETCADQSKLDQLSAETGQTLRVLMRNATDWEQVNSRLEHWFNVTMDRCSETYRRRMRWAAFWVAFVGATALNADAVEIAAVLYADAHVRLSNVTQTEGEAQMLQTLEISSRRHVAERVPSVVSMPIDTGLLPLGWENSRFAAGVQWSEQPWKDPAFWVGPVLSKLLTLAVTALAVSLGAGVWFDLLRRRPQRSNRVCPPHTNPTEPSQVHSD